MKTSVLLAAFKGERFIGEQLQSLCQQTRLPDEVLIGDDSGEDNATFEAVQEFRSKNDIPFELKYFRNPVPFGVNDNFRQLAAKAEGDIVFFCDQDDVWLPEKIEKLSDLLEKSPEIDAVCCFSFLTDGALVPWKIQEDTELKNAEIYGKFPEKLFKILLAYKISGAGHNIALRRTMVQKLPVWDSCFLYDPWILLSTAAAQKLLFLPERLTLHRVHEGNLTISSESYVGGNVSRRLKTIRSSSEKEAEFTRLLEERSIFAEGLKRSPLAEEIPLRNMQLVEETIVYLKQRIAFRERNFCLRLFPSFSLLKGYCLFGSNIRSFIRDLVGR